MKALEALEETKDWYLESDGSNYVMFGDTRQYNAIKQALTEQEEMKAKVNRYLDITSRTSKHRRQDEKDIVPILRKQIKDWSESNAL
jgi:hypothetical protein